MQAQSVNLPCTARTLLPVLVTSFDEIHSLAVQAADYQQSEDPAESEVAKIAFRQSAEEQGMAMLHVRATTCCCCW
jgi:hypothetical protein